MSPKRTLTVNGRPLRINLVLFFRFNRSFSLGKQRPADLAHRPVAAVRRAIFPAIINHAQVQRIPLFFGKQSFQVALGLHHIRAVRQFPPLGEPVNMRIDRERGESPDLAHHHRRRFVADTGQTFQFRKSFRHFPAVALHQELREADNCPGFLRRQPARPDDFLDLRHGNLRHIRRIIRQFPQMRGNKIHPFIRALGRQEHRHQQAVGTRVIQRDGRLRIKHREASIDVIRPTLSGDKFRRF